MGKRENSNILFWNEITSPLGDVFLLWRKEGVFLVSFIKEKQLKKVSGFVKYDFRIERSNSMLEKQLNEYFNGKRKEFELDLIMNGTRFQQKVWKELLKVPFGETVSYGEIAKRVGNPKGARSVGMAVSRNPLSIVIPCHRVIRSSGEIGGYAGGVYRKKWLLQHEGAFVSVK